MPTWEGANATAQSANRWMPSGANAHLGRGERNGERRSERSLACAECSLQFDARHQHAVLVRGNGCGQLAHKPMLYSPHRQISMPVQTQAMGWPFAAAGRLPPQPAATASACGVWRPQLHPAPRIREWKVNDALHAGAPLHRLCLQDITESGSRHRDKSTQRPPTPSQRPVEATAAHTHRPQSPARRQRARR